MNNSPFEVFRRNLKPLMVFLTGLALFAFVVLPVLDQYMRQNAGTGNERVLATFDGQNLTQERVDGFTRGHRATLFFLQDLAARTLKDGRQPQTAGFQQGQDGSITGLGINPEPSTEGSIRTFVFAGQATKKGFALSDSELAVWLERFCDGLYNEAELNSLAKKMSSNSMNLPMIKEQLRLHMLAQVFINRGYAGLRITTPDQTWRSFKKLNQKATANTYGVLVSDYMDEVEKLEVDSAGVTELYNEGKDRFPNPESSEPGFRRRYSAKFQYISGSAENFMADEISKLTEEELRAAYKLRVEGAKLMLPEQPAAEPKAEPAAEPKAEPAAEPKAEPAAEPKAEPAAEPKAEPAAEPKAEPAAEPKAEPAAEPKAEPAAEPKAEPAAEPKAEPAAEPKAEPAAEPKAEPVEGDSSQIFESSAVRLVTTQNQEGDKASDEADAVPAPADEKPADEKPADEKPADEKPADEKPADEKPADEKPADEKPADEKPADEKPADEKPADEKPADEKPADEKPADEKPADEKPADEKPADEKPADEKPADEKPADEKPADEKPADEKPADEKPADEKPADEKPADEKPADEKPADEKPADEKPADEKPADEKPADEKPEEPAVGTFEEERESLERQLATPKAQARLDAAMAAIFNEMQSYFNNKSIMSGMSPESAEKMEIKEPNLDALAKRYGLTYEEIGPHDALDIREEPISNSQVAGAGFMQQSPSFVQLMYTLARSGEPEKPLYSPLRTSAPDLANFALSKQYVSWKIEDKEAYIPTLDEVRDEVVSAWRMTKARELATEAATKIADAVNASAEATLADSVPEDKKKDFLNESLPAFQWMDPSFSPRMMQILSQLGGQIPPGISPDSATIGNVPDLDNVGEDFMKAVFTTPVNQAKTAVNRNGTVVYVVQPTEFMPSADILHEQFKQPQIRNAQVVQMLSGGDNAAVLNGFFESVDKDAGYTNYMLEDE